MDKLVMQSGIYDTINVQNKVGGMIKKKRGLLKETWNFILLTEIQLVGKTLTWTGRVMQSYNCWLLGELAASYWSTWRFQLSQGIKFTDWKLATRYSFTPDLTEDWKDEANSPVRTCQPTRMLWFEQTGLARVGTTGREAGRKRKSLEAIESFFVGHKKRPSWRTKGEPQTQGPARQALTFWWCQEKARHIPDATSLVLGPLCNC